MRWYERHIDASLPRWSLGALSTQESARLLRHAHGCARCGPRYERWAQAHRALEGNLDSPSSVEQQSLTDAGLAAALAAAEPREAQSRWPSLAVLGGALAAVFLAVLLVPPATRVTPGEFATRGNGPPPGVALRVFCSAAGQPMRELHAGDTCRAGAMLAFAAGGNTPYTHVALRVRGTQKGEVIAGPFPLPGALGNEGPLKLTLPMPPEAGAVEVVAAFSDRPDAALATLRGEQHEGSVVLKQEVKVEEGP
ncbi:hypothetical protein JY651_47000 [Pyxidicoccus parkwayensis]|uniref:Zinc-finger domain-containing protein n=1 Tax=Pyxidicoccus parkwayensis TaxID=2813578 RepID=A0ABX7NUV5_9BACT|nr:hypothetical protein [Pyxidicoccus parkwaysis]QSQ22580.1 hypothetical protein JY651_47000 [Pyxidicoccus parkwaysis]